MEAWRIQVWLLFGSRLVQTMMRMAMGPLLVYLCEEYKCGPTDKGSLLSAFSLGYVSSQIVGGALADMIGPKAVITGAMGLAAIATGLTPEAASIAGLDGVWWVTVVLGVMQGPLFPTSISYLSKWLPPSERSYASTMLDSGITVGSLIALPASGFVATALGWQTTFRVYGACSLLFVAIWVRWGADSPQTCKYITKEELEMLSLQLSPASGEEARAKGTPAAGKGKSQKTSDDGAKMPLAEMLSYGCVWAIFLSHMAYNIVTYFLSSWTPTYYEEVLGLRPEDAALHFTAPLLVNLFFKVAVAKPLMTYLKSPTGGNLSLISCRRWFSVVGFVGTAISLVGAGWVGAGTTPGNVAASTAVLSPIAATTLWISLAMAFEALQPSGFKANYMDLTSKSSGLLSGIGNTMASSASYVGPLAVGQALAVYNSWPIVYYGIAVGCVIAAVVYGALSSTDPIDAPKKSGKRE